jgi:hypothetical protein
MPSPLIPRPLLPPLFVPSHTAPLSRSRCPNPSFPAPDRPRLCWIRGTEISHLAQPIAHIPPTPPLPAHLHQSSTPPPLSFRTPRLPRRRLPSQPLSDLRLPSAPHGPCSATSPSLRNDWTHSLGKTPSPLPSVQHFDPTARTTNHTNLACQRRLTLPPPCSSNGPHPASPMHPLRHRRRRYAPLPLFPARPLSLDWPTTPTTPTTPLSHPMFSSGRAWRPAWAHQRAGSGSAACADSEPIGG